MQKVLRDDYKGDVHISLGMTTRDEINTILDFWKDQLHRVVLYACTSGYPVAHEDVHLLEISKLIEEYGKCVKAIGFSGHHLGIALDAAAVALGATWIERHFTLDRTWKGTDHAASLEPGGLEKLVRDVHAVQTALTYKPLDMINIEKNTRQKLKYFHDKA
jgi:N-acetylneuraminate synthase